MILSFKTHFKDGTLTHFRKKIFRHLGKDALDDYIDKHIQDHFLALILEDEVQSATPKKLTIRDDPNKRWKAGRKIHFATGARTKNYECFAIGECKAVASVWITLYKNGSYCITIDQDNLSYAKAQQLALDDGFKTLAEFLKFHTGTSLDPENYWDHPTADYPDKTIRKKVIHF